MTPIYCLGAPLIDGAVGEKIARDQEDRAPANNELLVIAAHHEHSEAFG